MSAAGIAPTRSGRDLQTFLAPPSLYSTRQFIRTLVSREVEKPYRAQAIHLVPSSSNRRRTAHRARHNARVPSVEPILRVLTSWRAFAGKSHAGPVLETLPGRSSPDEVSESRRLLCRRATMVNKCYEPDRPARLWRDQELTHTRGAEAQAMVQRRPLKQLVDAKNTRRLHLCRRYWVKILQPFRGGECAEPDEPASRWIGPEPG